MGQRIDQSRSYRTDPHEVRVTNIDFQGARHRLASFLIIEQRQPKRLHGPILSPNHLGSIDECLGSTVARRKKSAEWSRFVAGQFNFKGGIPAGEGKKRAMDCRARGSGTHADHNVRPCRRAPRDGPFRYFG